MYALPKKMKKFDISSASCGQYFFDTIMHISRDISSPVQDSISEYGTLAVPLTTKDSNLRRHRADSERETI